MGRLIDGVWSTHDLGPDEKGRYIRRATQFRNRVTADGSSGFPAEAHRYHLYLAHACGWCHRVLLFRKLKGLEDAISVSFAEPFMGAQGWTFAEGSDPVNELRVLHHLYTRNSPQYTGRVSVPVLWDKQAEVIVNNESSDLIQMLDRQFDALGNDQLHFFDEAHRPQMDAIIERNYKALNNGVYRAGFAGTQEAYEEAVRDVFAQLQWLEDHLSRHRYLCGDALTAADWCLLPTLLRFDAVYYIHFKCSLKPLREHPQLWDYTRELYQLPGVAETFQMAETKEHYYRSHESINPRRFVPLGPEIDFEQPHTRHHL